MRSAWSLPLLFLLGCQNPLLQPPGEPEPSDLRDAPGDLRGGVIDPPEGDDLGAGGDLGDSCVSIEAGERLLNPRLAWGNAHAPGRDKVLLSAGHRRLLTPCGLSQLGERIALDDAGKFSVAGDYQATAAMGGADLGAARPAHVSGTVQGKVMSLTIRLDDGSRTVGPYEFTCGDPYYGATCF